MAVKEISYSVSAAGINPATEQLGGTQGEHRATKLIFKLTDELNAKITEQAESGKAVYRFDAYDGEGNVVQGAPQELGTDTVPEFYIEEWLTRAGGRIRVYLVITVIVNESTEMELYSFPALLRLNNLPDAEVGEGETRESVATLAQSAKDSAEVAAQSMNVAVEAQEKTVEARLALEDGTEWHFQGGDAAGEVEVDLVIDTELSEESENPIANKAVAAEFAARKEETQNRNAEVDLQLEKAIMKVLDNGYNIDKLKLNGKFAVYNATGTLPSGYSSDDNNFFIECYMWFEHYGRQVLHDVRTNKTFSRNLFNDEWQPFEFVDYIVEQGTSGIWTYEKWASGKAVCWGQATTSSEADPASVYSKKLLFPFTFANDDYIVLVTSYQGTGAGYYAFKYYSQTTTTCWVGSNGPSVTVAVEIKGKWK